MIRAHKVILSAVSPLFQSILASSTTLPLPLSGLLHPVIYLNGISSRNLRHVVDFMYEGQVNVGQDELNSFLAAAEELQIKGLTQGNGASNRSESLPSTSNPAKRPSSSAGPTPAKKRAPQPTASARTSPSPSTSGTLSRPKPPPADETDIQDVTPIKSEDPSGQQSLPPTNNDGGDVGNDGGDDGDTGQYGSDAPYGDDEEEYYGEEAFEEHMVEGSAEESKGKNDCPL